MFSWSGVFSPEPQVPGQRSPEEMVTDTLMLELGVLLKRAERLQQERGAEVRRRRSSVDYSWLADPPQRPAYEPSTGELLELCHLCAKIRPRQCGPVILRLRKLVAEFEPDAHEVPRIFRSVLLDCLDEEDGRAGSGQGGVRAHAGHWDKQRSKSLSYITFRSQFLVNPFRGGRSSELQEDGTWSGDEEEPAPPEVSGRTRRVHSMPDMTPVEERVQS